MQFVTAGDAQRIAIRAHDCLLEPSSSGLRMGVDRPPPSAHEYPLRERCGSQRPHATRTCHELPQIMRIQLMSTEDCLVQSREVEREEKF